MKNTLKLLKEILEIETLLEEMKLHSNKFTKNDFNKVSIILKSKIEEYLNNKEIFSFFNKPIFSINIYKKYEK